MTETWISHLQEFYAVADLHISSRNTRWKGANQHSASEALHHLLKRSAPVFLLGDIKDEYVEPDPLWNNEPIKRLLQRADEAGTYLRGNHDNQSTFNKLDIVVIDGGIALTHGHMFDPLCGGPLEPITDLLGWAAFQLDRVSLRASSLARHIRDRNFHKRALAWARRRALKLVICGHTHEQGVWKSEDGGTTLAVAGSWKCDPPYPVLHYTASDGVSFEGVT